MRIAVWHNLPSGGGKRALYDHVAYLVSKGHYVESWCPPSADQTFLPLSHLVTEHVVPLDAVVPSRRLTLQQLASDTSEAVRAMDHHCLACAREIAKGNFDVLYANSCSSFRVTSIGRQVNLPKVLYLQEPYRWLYEALPDPPWAANSRPAHWWFYASRLRAEVDRSITMRLRAVQLREEVRNAAAFDVILCNSFFSRESILRAYGINSRVCYLGVDTETFRLDVPSATRGNFFLTVGALVAEKNSDFLIRSLGLRADRSWPLVWVANFVDTKIRARALQLADDLGVQLDLRVAVDDRMLIDLYKTAGLFLYAPRLEPFGFAPLEAAACGLPAVAVAEAGVRETVVHGQSGVLVGADLAEFAAAIDAVLSTPVQVSTLGSRARSFVEERWSLRAAGRRLEEILIDMATSARSSDPLAVPAPSNPNTH